MKRKIFLFGIMLGIGLFISYKTVQKQKIIHNNQKIVDIVLQNSFQKQNIINRIINTRIEWDKSIRLLKKDYLEVTEDKKIEYENPIIYLYNSHPTEEYSPSTIGEYSLNPTVIMNNYILEDIFNKNGYKTYVEEESVKDILQENNWNYASSYKASRILLEQRKEAYPTLTYFIDIHRDSLSHDRTSITIEDRDYAKLLFIVGLENENYESNLTFTEKINNCLLEKYPNLSKGIYKKEGAGVNGVYNQDFSPYTILVEIGGYENTTVEVLNTTLAFSKCYLEVINEESH